ncbi:MAG: proline dehydrogenase family protein, partial [Acidobacteriota bacterium]
TNMLLESPVYHAIATHDENMIAAAKAFASEHAIDRSRFEFQMLYGVRRDLQRALVQEGYKVRVYVPFGTEWYPYFMRRLAERPANVIFLARNFFR